MFLLLQKLFSKRKYELLNNQVAIVLEYWIFNTCNYLNEHEWIFN